MKATTISAALPLPNEELLFELDALSDCINVIFHDLMEHFMEDGEENLIRDGLKVFGSMGEKKCPLGCIYCFVNAKGFKATGRVETSHTLQELTYDIERGDISVILPSHDVEIFLVKDWDKILMDLTSLLGLNIIISTKIPLNKGFPPHNEKRIERLKIIDDKLKEKNAMLLISVSLTRLRDWKEIEVFVPSPEQRIVTLQRLSKAGLSVSVALRPTLPFVPEEEFEELIASTALHCESYLVSPLYLTPEMRRYMDTKFPHYRVDLFQPAFMGGRTIIETVQTDSTMAMVKEIAKRYNRPCFSRSIPALEYSLSLRKK